MAANKKKVSLSEIARYLNTNGIETEIRGNGAEPFSLSSPESADGSSLVFWFSGDKIPDNIKNIAVSQKSYTKNPPEKENILIVTGDIKTAFAYATHLFSGYALSAAGPGLSYIAESALISANATIGNFVHIGENSIIGDNCRIYPFSYIGDNVTIGDNTIIKPHSVILNDVTIGRFCLIESGAVIGGDGFGFVRDKDKIIKIEHLGRVIIGDFVEINASSTVDKGTLDNTVIGNYTKIDNLVQVAHNVQLGRGNLITSQVAVAGSSKVGDFNILAGQAGVTDNVSIGDNNIIAGKAGVTKDIGSNQVISGFPSRPHKEELVRQANISKISKMAEQIKNLEQEIANLKKEFHADND